VDINRDIPELKRPSAVRGFYRLNTSTTAAAVRISSNWGNLEATSFTRKRYSCPCHHPRHRIWLGVVLLHGVPLSDEKEAPVRDQDVKQIETFYLAANSTPNDFVSLPFGTAACKTGS